MSRHTSTSHSGTGDWLLSAVRNNPEGLLLLAAGCALLMRSGGGSRHTGGGGQGAEFGTYSEGRPGHYAGMAQQTRSGSMMGATGKDLREGLSQASDTVRHSASELAESVSEAASSYASAASNYAAETRRAVSEQSARYGRQAQSAVQETLNRVVHEQPLSVALLGLAAGAAVAAAFPTTDVERRALGPAGERLTDAAARAGEQLKEATARAGERLAKAAEERGLTSEGVKEVAREVAQAFEGSASGPHSDGKGQSGPSGASQQSSSDMRAGQLGHGGTPGSAQTSATHRTGEEPVKPSGQRGTR